MANTTNYNWATPDNTDLVKDGAAAIRTLGNSIDTTTKALNPETTLGDIAYRSSTSNTNTRLPIGSNGQILGVSAGVPAWINNDQGDITEVQAGTGISVASGTGPIPVVTNTVATAYDAKGDLIVGTGADTFSKLSVGTNGYTLVADSAQTSGLKWAVDPVADVVTTAGDLLYATAADTVTRLGIGTAGQVLKVNSGATAPEWGAAGGAYTLLSTTNLSGTETSVTGISGSYQHLMVVLQDYYLSASQNVRYKFNADTTANNYRGFYDYVLFGGSPASNTAYFSGANLPDTSNEQTDDADEDRISILMIYNYAAASATKLFSVQTKNRNSSDEYAFGAGWGYWGNTGQNAITSIQVTTFTGTPTFSGGTIKIYGVK